MALYHFCAKILSHSTRNTVGAVAYRAGCELLDLRTGESYDYGNKAVQHVELVVPENAPQWIRNIQDLINTDRQEGVQALTQKVEAAEYRINSQVWREIEIALHFELTKEQNITLAREFVKDQLCGRGMTALLNFHLGSPRPDRGPGTSFDVDEERGQGDYPRANPHCHILLTMRTLNEEGFNSKKERGWNTKAFIQELREQWANYSNFYLKLYGHDVQIDHRSNKERGIDMEPQPKRGRNVLELERKATVVKNIEPETEDAGIGSPGKDKFKSTESSKSTKSTQSVHPLEDLKSDENTKATPVTERMQAFRVTQLRNLYRIMRKPEVILDIVTKHQATFMWADVQKKLHQYVDNPALFERLEDKIKTSKELVLLRSQKVLDSSGMEHEKAIYTTRGMLKAERSLIEQAEELENAQTHGVQKKNIAFSISKANEKLKIHGGLSHDQIKAIHHLVGGGQIKCVVGIAGAGKTTAIGVCHEIWKRDGYVVYGLAPTGKASQNLEGSSLESNGIPSTTLHKFQKSFEEGRCQYNEKSVLVLDEAAMVDVERFDKLLSAVRQLGVKLIVVGDGAQLQPVEAGPAFRLVTEKLGRSELTTVVRQKEEWQREATVLFGQQRTEEALQKYEEKECIHIIEETLPSLNEAINAEDYDSIVHLYEVSHRVSSLIYREMVKDVRREYPELKKLYPKIREHKDFQKYLDWKDIEKNAADTILENAQKCCSVLKARNVDTLKFALVFKDNKKDKVTQQEEAKTILKQCGLDHLIGVEKRRGQTVDVRQTAKEELIREWHAAFKACSRAQDPRENPEKSTAILAYSNKDVNDLNRQVRFLLKKSGHLSKGEFTFNIKREIEDDFGKKLSLKEQKGFSKGDRIVFTKNQHGLGVKNGTMGTITDINNQNIKVKLDEGKEISFSPNLNPYFDQGWAITIHKSQGATFDQTYVLASFEMTQNLTYVAMTRHREGVKMFGSSFDFWRFEKLPEILSKSGEKLSAADYLDADSLSQLMKKDDQILTKFFQRMSNELEAMGAVTKEAFWNVADFLGSYAQGQDFLGRTRQKEIRILQESVREEVRAEELFKEENAAIKRVSSFLENAESLTRISEKTAQSESIIRNPHKKEAVEETLKAHMANFADHVFASLGEGYNRSMSSRTERRYGKKGEFAVNLQKGVWLSYKDSQLAGGPLHLLTKLKNLSYQEAIAYGASWSGLSPEQVMLKKKSHDFSPAQKEALEKEVQDRKKIARALSIYAKGRPIQGTLAERYLREHRKIEGPLPEDLLSLPASRIGKSSSPALMTVARSNEGRVTAVQLTFLDSYTANKANISVQKRSYGSLKGAAVTIQSLERGERGEPVKSPNLLFIAEGIETALSLKEAGIKGTIKASLGLSNIKRLEPADITSHIIICGDHDTSESPATKSLEKSAQVLQERGYKVTVIKPDKLGEDFNDVLKTKGPEGVREILAKNLPKDFLASLQTSVEKDPQRDSYTIEAIKRREAEQLLKSERENSAFTLEGKSFKEIVAYCEKRLHGALARDRKPLTKERAQRFPLQAERTATFLIHIYEHNGRNPTQEELAQLSLRAKYELNRIPEIRKELIKDWQKKDSFKENEGLRTHMIAERLASIEGRLYLEAKQTGAKIPSTIAKLAHQELKKHQARTPKLAEELSQKYDLSKDVATNFAKNILRYKETHGTHPSELQIATIIQVSQKLEMKGYTSTLNKKVNRLEANYLQRYEGDRFFKHISCEKDTLADTHISHIQEQAKRSLEMVSSQIYQELTISNDL